MRNKLMVAFGAAVCAFAASAVAYEMGDELSREEFWRSDPVLFVRKHAESGFEFTSDQRDCADSRRDGGVTCFGMPVYETRVSFGAAGGIERVELMLYTSGGTEAMKEFVGSDGRKFLRRERVERNMSREEFSAALDKVRKRLTEPGSKPPQIVREAVGMRDARQRSQTWPQTKLPTKAALSWSFEQDGKAVETFRPGFIRLAVDGPARLSDPSSRKGVKKPASASGAKKIADNVIDESKGRGDVFVDGVPMVDQGQKGYCAAATAERVLRYYGLDIDEHQIAEAAGTSAERGTSSLAMKNSIEAIGKRFKLGTVVCYGDFDKGVDARIAGLVDEVRVYNKAAKKLKKREIPGSVYITHRGNVTFYDPGAVDREMDPEVLKEMKVNGAQKSKYTKFRKDIHDQILKGIPLIWGVKLGCIRSRGFRRSAATTCALSLATTTRRTRYCTATAGAPGTS